ncbi:hypothetical protein [Thermococcus sp.]|uniref:hypothetical protein n=1 Tax=Thermococcus sp. TaxID=35749 RepID=UPI00260D7F5D|nr:hypothetical protein [Thermococcus sp.]
MRAIFYVEVLGRTRWDVKEEVERIVSYLKWRNLRPREVGETIEDESMAPAKFSAYVEAELSGSLGDLLNAAVDLSPTMVEVLSPSKLEIPAGELSGILRGVAERVRGLMRELGFSPLIQDIPDLPTPAVGFDEDELWDLVYQDRKLLVRMGLDVPGSEEMERALVKLLAIDGCGVNSISRSEGGLTLEVIGSFESVLGFISKYPPAEFEVLEPAAVELTAYELQNAMSDLGGFLRGVRQRDILGEAYESDAFSFKL